MYRENFRDTGSHGGYFFFGMLLGGALVFALPFIVPFAANWAVWFACGCAPVAGVAMVRSMRDALRRARERREQMWDDCWDPWDVCYNITGGRRRRHTRPSLTASAMAVLRRPLF